ncbi:MAG: hypothetical protein LC796_06020 [Acidobacteria bacterium]|nr:hypothetical protein [Acidobacteriota bacterium]MCA1610109.1 hypothetical protein [Acidobacteriota bacterium]
MVLWTILTAALFLLLLVALAWALSMIFNALSGIRRSLEKIAWGVRAIEVETSPLPGGISGVAGGLTAIGGGLVAVQKHLTSTADNLPGAARALGLIP